MLKINMNTKFFHGIDWDGKNNDRKLFILNKILDDGKILSPKEQYKRKNMTLSNNNNKIFLSVYPNGFFANDFPGKDFLRDSYTGFDMTRSSFYFILNKDLQRDFTLLKGAYPLECIVQEAIPLDKYLVGIGNAGYTINQNLQFCYYYTRFLNKEITQQELKNRIKDFYFPENLNTDYVNDLIKSKTRFCHEYRGNTDYNQDIFTSISKEPEELIYPGILDDINKIFQEHNMPVLFYDNAGYRVYKEQQLIKVKKMKEYISKNAKYIKKPGI